MSQAHPAYLILSGSDGAPSPIRLHASRPSPVISTRARTSRVDVGHVAVGALQYPLSSADFCVHRPSSKFLRLHDTASVRGRRLVETGCSSSAALGEKLEASLRMNRNLREFQAPHKQARTERPKSSQYITTVLKSDY